MKKFTTTFLLLISSITLSSCTTYLKEIPESGPPDEYNIFWCCEKHLEDRKLTDKREGYQDGFLARSLGERNGWNHIKDLKNAKRAYEKLLKDANKKNFKVSEPEYGSNSLIIVKKVPEAQKEKIRKRIKEIDDRIKQLTKQQQQPNETSKPTTTKPETLSTPTEPDNDQEDDFLSSEDAVDGIYEDANDLLDIGGTGGSNNDLDDLNNNPVQVPVLVPVQDYGGSGYSGSGD